MFRVPVLPLSLCVSVNGEKKKLRGLSKLMDSLSVSHPAWLFVAGAICNFISRDKTQTLDTKADFHLSLTPSLSSVVSEAVSGACRSIIQGDVWQS